MKQLDGLRGLAILSVFAAHFTRIPISDPLFVPSGSFGVRLFFVLSGFLISGILIKTRSRIDDGQQSVAFSLKSFYGRRVIRILIVYYVWLTFSQIRFSEDRFWWDIFYLSNFYDIWFNEGHGNHYWSLAVEEQFYLLWPVLVLVLPKRHWFTLFGGAFILGVGLRIAFGAADVPYLTVKKLPITCFDAMAAGAVVALYYYGDTKHSFEKLSRYAKPIGCCGVALFLVAIAALRSTGTKNAVYTMTLHTSFALIATGLLIPAIQGVSGIWGRILSSRALCWIGQISYGCYLYHLFVQMLVTKYCTPLFEPFLPVPATMVLAFVLKVGCTLIVAQLSWICFERQVLRLKRYFPMEKPNVVVEGSAA